MKTLVTCLLALAASISSSQATLLAYEGFDTANAIGSDASAAGVTGSGFSAYGDTNYRYDLEAGLGYTDGIGNTLNTVGKSAGMASVGTTSGTQNLQLTLSSAIESQPGSATTIYMSFIADVTAVDSFGFSAGLQDAAVGNGASPTAAHEGVMRSTSSNFGIYADAQIDVRTGPAVGTGKIFFVAKFDLATGTDTMTGYYNPTNLADVAGTAAQTSTGTGTLDDMTTFLFSLGGQENGAIDEIRIGTTIADVTPFTPVPEPTSAVLFGLGGLALLLRRRK